MPLSRTGAFAALRYAVFALIALLVIDACVPLAPFMPRAGIDGSWMYALNQAVAHQLAFGREIVFTFGPYASVFTHVYDPATLSRMLAGSGLVAVVYLLCLAVLLRRREGRAAALAGIAFFLLLAGADSLLLTLPLLATLALLSWLHGEPGKAAPPILPVLVLAWIACGLLPLVKGSLAVMCVLAVAVGTAALLHARRPAFAALAAGVPLVALAAFWTLAGQALPDLLAYAGTMGEIVSGYSDGMAFEGPAIELLLFGVPSAALLAALAMQRQMPVSRRVATTSITGLFLFLSFKAAFVRQDGHALIAPINLVAAVSLLWPTLSAAPPTRRWPVAILLVAGAVCALDAADRARQGQEAFAGAPSNPLSLRVSNARPGRWADRYDAAVRSIRAGCALGDLPQADTDIYPNDQSCVLAQALPWSPRPTLQSYVAYTPALARLDEAHLRRPGAPRQLLYRLQSIDGRLPALDGGSSLPALLDNYALLRRQGPWLVLGARSMPAAHSHFEAPLAARGTLGQPLPVPPGMPLFATVTLRPTWAGRLAALLYKPPQLFLRTMLADGSERVWPLGSRMAESGFMLSPLLQSTEDVAALFEARLDERRRVVAIQLETVGLMPGWHDDYTVSFRRHLPRPTGLDTSTP